MAGILAYLKWNETELVFQLGQSHAYRLATIPAGIERVDLPLAGGEKLAIVVRRATGTSGFWILHLHGNADSMLSPTQLDHVQKLADLGFNVVAMDYRGFGASTGLATEANVLEDAETAFQWLITQGVPPERIILWGHSLGSGPAVELAARHRVAGLVLFGAFTSVADVAADVYPWLPVRWIVGIHFYNLQRIRNVHVPVIMAHVVTDLTIPYSHGGRLFAAANEPKRFFRLKAKSDDGFGGHVNALYEQLEVVTPAMKDMFGVGGE